MPTYRGVNKHAHTHPMPLARCSLYMQAPVRPLASPLTYLLTGGPRRIGCCCSCQWPNLEWVPSPTSSPLYSSRGGSSRRRRCRVRAPRHCPLVRVIHAELTLGTISPRTRRHLVAVDWPRIDVHRRDDGWNARDAVVLRAEELGIGCGPSARRGRGRGAAGVRVRRRRGTTPQN